MTDSHLKLEKCSQEERPNCSEYWLFSHLTLVPADSLPQPVPTLPTCMNCITKNAFMFAFLLEVSGASHEVFLQRIPPLAPAGPVTHGGREGELISPYIPAATSSPLAHTPRHTQRRHPSPAIPRCAVAIPTRPRVQTRNI